MIHSRWMRLQALVMAGVLAAGITACGTTNKTYDDANYTDQSGVEEPADEDTAPEEADDAASETATEGATEDAAEGSTEDADTEALDGVRKRRTLPHGEAKVSDSTAAEDAKNPNAVAEDYPSSVSEIVRLDTYKGSTVSYKELKNVAETEVKAVDDSYPESQEDMEQMLQGLMSYWADGNMESVDYLVRMGKYEYLSQMLNGSDDYFYVGEENADGEPNGTGIAVYANNAYYYGQFADGERSGSGFWYQIFVQDGPYSKANNGIIGHSYNGEWANDLPNGEGQEHLDIDTAYLGDRVINNVKTTFADGYYNGEIVATSLETGEGQINWTGEARYGTMVVIEGEYVKNDAGKSEVRVLQNVDNENNYYWMLLEENCGQGITGLVD